MITYLYGALLFIGLVLLYFANNQFQRSRHLVENGIRTTAKVIDLIPSRDSDGTTYTPVFEYKDRNSSIQSFQGEVSSNPPSYKVGEKVKIVYNPNDPDQVKTIAYWGLYRWTIVLLSIAAPFLIIGGGYFLFRWG